MNLVGDPKRRSSGAIQDPAECSGPRNQRASVLECGGAPPLSFRRRFQRIIDSLFEHHPIAFPQQSGLFRVSKHGTRGIKCLIEAELLCGGKRRSNRIPKRGGDTGEAQGAARLVFRLSDFQSNPCKTLRNADYPSSRERFNENVPPKPPNVTSNRRFSNFTELGQLLMIADFDRAEHMDLHNYWRRKVFRIKFIGALREANGVAKPIAESAKLSPVKLTKRKLFLSMNLMLPGAPN